MQLLFHPDEDDSDDYNLKCGVEDIQWSVEVVLTTGMSSKCSRDIAQCSATQWPILQTCTIVLPHRVYSLWQHDGTVWVAVLWYGMVSDGILWVGQHDGIFS